jgi:hypothetical protein
LKLSSGIISTRFTKAMPTSWARSSTLPRICAGSKKASCRSSPCPTGWAAVRKRPSAKAEGKPREDFIVTIDRSDDSTAFIKVRCQLPPRYFTDYLVAMKLNDGWQIVSKSYRYDLRE